MNSTENPTRYTEVNPFEMEHGHRGRIEPVSKLRVYLATICVNLSSMAAGTCIGWTSPMLPKLINNTPDNPLGFGIDSEQNAWISSLIAVGALITPFIAGPLASGIGRKWTMLSGSLFFLVAYILMLFGSSVWLIYIARLVQGFGVGFTMTVVPMYVGEIATDDCRGALGSFMQLFIVTGILFCYSIGPYVSYMVLQWCCIVIPIIFAVIFFFFPESPYYYAEKGRKLDAIKSLQFLRGQSSAGVQDEMSIIQATVEESLANKGSFVDVFKGKGNRKALIISVGLITFQQLSGINVVLFNSETIFQKANTGLDPAIATILVGVVQLLSSAVTPLIADRLGKKAILLLSSSVMCIGLATLGTFFYIQDTGDASGLLWLPVPALILFVIVYCLGFGPLPWAVMGEMFPGNVKPAAASIVASTCWIFGFFITRYYPALDALGAFYAFYLFTIFCAIAFFFTLFVVMETKGMSLKEIQDRLNNRR